MLATFRLLRYSTIIIDKSNMTDNVRSLQEESQTLLEKLITNTFSNAWKSANTMVGLAWSINLSARLWKDWAGSRRWGFKG